MAARQRRLLWRSLGTLATLLLLACFALALKEPVTSWFEGPKKYDRDVLQEWIRETRVYRTLPELLERYLQHFEDYRIALKEAQERARRARQALAENNKPAADGQPIPDPDDETRELKQRYEQKQHEIRTHLGAVLDPITKIYKGQLPLFPVIYRLTISFDENLNLPDIIWDSELPRQKNQTESLNPPVKLTVRVKRGDQEVVHDVEVQMQYHLRVFASREYQQRQAATRLLQLGALFTIFLTLLLLWYYLARGREHERQRQRLAAEQQLNDAERLRLQEELRRQEAERRHEEAERSNLELKSQLWANIGVLAGSYAHNIKNLLVRPNDLLARCLEVDGLSSGQEHMLQEVRQTLGTVTERLQQILQTVRRDPTQAERVQINLNDLVEEMRRTWQDLAREKWKMALTVELADEPLWIEGDRSHLQQGIENLLFNSRDATFEMRNFLREQARQTTAESAVTDLQSVLAGPAADQVAVPDRTAVRERRRALIAAASWTGTVLLRTERQDGKGVLVVSDNGIGMSEEVRQRCTETHFSTKRHNALYAGFNAGMGLGLSFIRMILEHHQATMTIESQNYQGTTFRIAFPLVKEMR
jgi:signal transduction histidine kinase